MSMVFDPFPATHAGRSFAGTWWGKAWVSALEDTSLDHAQLRKGRSYARRGHVGAIMVEPGKVIATVRDPSLDEFRAVVHVEQLSDAQWERFGEAIAAKSGHLLALIDGEMQAELVESAAAADVLLLPSVGDLEPECGCDAWDVPCVHAAALAYQVAWLLDADPFVLMLLRGRGEEALLGQLRTRAGEPSRAPAGIGVRPAQGVDPDEVRRLVAVAAARAADLLATQSTV